MKHHSTQRQYWKSLEHLANTPEIQESASKEFASYDPAGMLSMSPVTRRRFMKLMGASMALAGLSLNGCRRWPEEKLAPYASRPPGTEPGVPQQYATAMELAGVASPLLVSSYDGRPIKIEGNPTHPFSETVRGRAGSADALAQASVWEMYDPDRSATVIDRSGSAAIAADWDRFTSAMSSTIDALTSSSGGALAVLCEATSSLTTARLKAALAKRFPTTFYEYEPLSRDNETAGIKMAMGKPARQRLRLDKAKVVVLLDADPLGTHPAHVRYAGDWVKQRPNKEKETSRVYCIESAMTISGSVSDCRMGVRP
jgi:MoCo/4Fe-4S cofactor protein with predicted Tat translocation signal